MRSGQESEEDEACFADRIYKKKQKWKQEIEAKLILHTNSRNPSIYRVPNKLRKVKDDAYDPRVVSIGPLHRDNPDLAGMREQKWRYLLYFFQQKQRPHEGSKDCLRGWTSAIYDLDADVRSTYADDISSVNEDDLAEIMLVDGCFIVELFIRFHRRQSNMMLQDSESDDPILKSAWMIAALRHDLALLENQIPFFILQHLYDTIRPHHVDYELPHSLSCLALSFFQRISQKATREEWSTDGYEHLLDLLRKFYFLPRVIKLDIELIPEKQHLSAVQKRSSSSCHLKADDPLCTTKWGLDYCASELLESGIEFDIASSEDQLLDITFREGVIRIPSVFIHETITSSLFRNLIAFEQCSISTAHAVTSYAILIKGLISCARDSKLLQEKGIIKNHNWIGDQEYLSQFKTILHEVVAKDFYFGKLCDEVNAYCTTWWHLRKLRGFLRVRIQRDARLLLSTYFSTPWSFISFMAALAILLLSSLQTYYAMHPRCS